MRCVETGPDSGVAAFLKGFLGVRIQRLALDPKPNSSLLLHAHTQRPELHDLLSRADKNARTVTACIESKVKSMGP